MHFIEYPLWNYLYKWTCQKCSVWIPWCCPSFRSGYFLHSCPLAGCRTQQPAASTPSHRRAVWTETPLLRKTKLRRVAPSASQQQTCLSPFVFLSRLFAVAANLHFPFSSAILLSLLSTAFHVKWLELLFTIWLNCTSMCPLLFCCKK